MERTTLNYRERLSRRLKDLGSCCVLDAGTGAGEMTRALNRNLDAFVVSVDVNKTVFSDIRYKVDRRRVEFVVSDFRYLPFKNEALCAVVCDLVISTSGNWQPASVYSEFKRVLQPRSSLYVTDYYPEKAPRSRDDRLGVETWKLYRAVLKSRGSVSRPEYPPLLTIATLKQLGFASVKRQRVQANEPVKWKRRVFQEYYRGMKNEISKLTDCRQQGFLKAKLEKLKRQIVEGRKIHWGWGVNYLIEAVNSP